MQSDRYHWAATGDVNAFFGLMLDNIAGLVLTVVMLSGIFGFPVDFALQYMIPGTAIGVLVGDLMYFWLAFRLAKRESRADVTAMPLGLDTPSTIGMVLFVLGPAYIAASNNAYVQIANSADVSLNLARGSIEEIVAAVQSAATAHPSIDAAVKMVPHQAAMQTWHIGICAIFITGLIKGLLAFGSNWIRRVFPRAGLLGSLAAIALVLIAFTQMPKLAVNPIVGFAALAIVLVTLVARGELPFKIPGALGAVMLGCVVWYVMMGIDQAAGTELTTGLGEETAAQWFPTQWLTVFSFSWLGSMGATLGYLPYIIPFAIATVIGGIDCTESAASAGDDFRASHVIGIESLATLIASLCGGVIQTTPYIGHPAYKAMGGRAAYTLATALFVGGAGVVGYFSVLFILIPEAAVLPILVFIGIEITAQSFHATPRRHYSALAIACLPALAKLVMIYLGQYAPAINYDQVKPEDAENLQSQFLHLQILSGGFIITSLIWGAAMARIIDKRFFSASIYFAVGGLFVLFGVIHSPLAGDKMFWPWNIGEPDLRIIVVEFAAAYLIMALIMFGLGWLVRTPPIDTDEDYESLSRTSH